MVSRWLTASGEGLLSEGAAQGRVQRSVAAIEGGGAVHRGEGDSITGGHSVQVGHGVAAETDGVLLGVEDRLQGCPLAPLGTGGQEGTGLGWLGCPGASGAFCPLTLNATTTVTARYKTLLSQAIAFGVAPTGLKVGGTGFISATASS